METLRKTCSATNNFSYFGLIANTFCCQQFLEELDEEEGPLDDHLKDVIDDEGSIDAEKGHERANRDSQEAPGLPATATATTFVASPSDIIGAPIKLNRNDVKNVLKCRVPGCLDGNRHIRLHQAWGSTWLCRIIKETHLAHIATGTAASDPTRLEVARIYVVSTNVISFQEGDLKWMG